VLVRLPSAAAAPADRPGHSVGELAASPYPSDMTARPLGDDWYRLWPAARPYVRMMVLSFLPVPDLPSRLRVRRVARSLVACDPWPGMEATGSNAAQLALLRLLHLQKETRRAVRSRQDEAVTRLARTAIETLITGLYCVHEPTAPARLQGEATYSFAQPDLEPGAIRELRDPTPLMTMRSDVLPMLSAQVRCARKRAGLC
jgi:hypothetical protein